MVGRGPEGLEASGIPPWCDCQPHWLFCIASTLLGALFVVLTPPFQAGDEPAHFLRAWQLSEGHFVADEYGGTLPGSLGTCFMEYDSIRFHQEAKTSIAAIKKGFSIRLFPRTRVFYKFPNTAIYSPVPYVGTSILIGIGRILGFGPQGTMYLGRLGNLAAYVLIGTVAIRQIPVLKIPTFLLLTSPLPLFLAGSLSADALTTSVVCLATAIIAKIATGVENVSSKVVLRLGVALAAVQLCKWAYAPILILVIAIPEGRWGGASARRKCIGGIFLVCLLSLWCWTLLSGAEHDRMHGGDPGAQLSWMVHHPARFLGLATRTLVGDARYLIYTSMGALGWQDALLPNWFVGLQLAVLMLSAMNEPKASLVTRRFKAMAFLMICASVLFLLILEYLGWNRVGSPAIEGLQGRYLIPLFLPCFILICCNRIRLVGCRFAVCWVLVSSVVSITVLLHRYY